MDTAAKDVAQSVQRNDIHPPSTLLNAFTSRLSAPEDSRVLFLRGVYVRKGNKLYGSGYAYDELVEETSDSRLTLQVPGPLRSSLKDGAPYVLLGSLAKVPRSNRGTIELHFVVADVLEELEPRFTEEDLQTAKLLALKGEKGFRNVEALLQRKLYADERPTLTLLYGVTAIVDADVRAALAEAGGRYELFEVRVSLTDPQSLARALQDAQGDAVAVVRGGGAGLRSVIPTCWKRRWGSGCPLSPLWVTPATRRCWNRSRTYVLPRPPRWGLTCVTWSNGSTRSGSTLKRRSSSRSPLSMRRNPKRQQNSSSTRTKGSRPSPPRSGNYKLSGRG